MKSRILALVGLLFTASYAHAACKQADLKGTWITSQAAVLAEEPHAGQCTLEVDKTGNVLEGSYCSFYPVHESPLPTTGVIEVAKDCSALIKLSLGDWEGSVQVSKNKQVWAGRFKAQGDTVYGTTTAIKQ
jgi:hypothetical protein